MQLNQAIDSFFAWLAPRKLSPSSIKAYKQDIELIGRELASVTGVGAKRSEIGTARSQQHASCVWPLLR